MSTYGWVLLISSLFPVIFSFHPKIRFYKNWGKTLLASLMVAIPFWMWDAIATARGDWGFNKEHVGPTKIAGMPIEEILFFLVIPFCCLFIWEILEKYIKEKKVNLPKYLKIGAGVLVLAGIILAWGKYYTVTILGWAALTGAAVQIWDKTLWKSSNYWKWMGITFVPFLMVNGVLTSLPIVSYRPEAIWGGRVGTIPSEDFLYSWSLLTLNLVVYRKLRPKN